jgi:transketolase C-terminal domain/subunit
MRYPTILSVLFAFSAGLTLGYGAATHTLDDEIHAVLNAQPADPVVVPADQPPAVVIEELPLHPVAVAVE